MQKIKLISFLVVISFLFSCNQLGNPENKSGNTKLKVVATTTMLTDLVNQIGGNQIEVYGLMGSGVDPHLYKASEGDVSKLFNADVIFYNGLHLEGKMDVIFEQMHNRGVKTYTVGKAIPEKKLLHVSDDYSHHDPHVWFDVEIWKIVAKYVAGKLIENNPEHKDEFAKNLQKYLESLEELQKFNINMIKKIPMDRRVLITAHDAFEYFGNAYNFEVVGLQGISTVSEAGVADVRDLADFIYQRKVPAIFIESSVPRRNIEALQAAVISRGLDVEIGGKLFSDALGSPGTVEGTYIGMYKHNVTTIVEALKK